MKLFISALASFSHFLCSSIGFSTDCSPIRGSQFQCIFSMVHNSFGNIYLFQWEVLNVLLKIPALASWKIITNLDDLSAVFILFLPHCTLLAHHFFFKTHFHRHSISRTAPDLFSQRQHLHCSGNQNLVMDTQHEETWNTLHSPARNQKKLNLQSFHLREVSLSRHLTLAVPGLLCS